MKFAVSEEICTRFAQHNIKYASFSEAEPEADLIVVKVKGEHGLTAQVNVIVAKSGREITLSVRPFAYFPAEKRGEALELVNRLNQQYRFLRFILNADGGVQGRIDLPQEAEDPSTVVFEAFARTVQILNATYPTLMKAIWG